MGLKPDGDAIRSAVQWINIERIETADIPIKALIEAACLRFNLSPLDAEFLARKLNGETA